MHATYFSTERSLRWRDSFGSPDPRGSSGSLFSAASAFQSTHPLGTEKCFPWTKQQCPSDADSPTPHIQSPEGMEMNIGKLQCENGKLRGPSCIVLALLRPRNLGGESFTNDASLSGPCGRAPGSPIMGRDGSEHLSTLTLTDSRGCLMEC